MFDTRQDLIEFTGLHSDIIDALLERRLGMFLPAEEWRNLAIWERFDHWFYLSGKQYLFTNAIHGYAPGCGFLDVETMRRFIPDNAIVLDYAGGTGNAALATADRGYVSHYRELSALQAEFVRFRAWKYGLDVTVLGWWKPLAPIYDLVCFDSIGHVVDQKKTLEEIIAAIKPGGALYLKLDDFLYGGFPVGDERRWQPGAGEQTMHVGNQIGEIDVFLALKGLHKVEPFWVKARVGTIDREDWVSDDNG